MPICKKCNNQFPNRVTIEGKQRILNRRKYCLDCSPFDKHNTKQLDKFPSDLTICCKCGKSYLYERGKGLSRTICGSCLTNRQRNWKKEKAVQLLGGKCQLCGYDKCNQALQFHHKNPEKKEFGISGMYCISWERIEREIKKCILLCANCHTEVENGITDLPP